MPENVREFILITKKNLIVEEWFNSASDDDIIDLMDAYIVDAPVKITHCRLNEVGDFRDQKQVRQMNRVAKHFKENSWHKNLHLYTSF